MEHYSIVWNNMSAHVPLSAHDFHILLSLFEEDLHGYRIIRTIEERTDGELVLGTSSLYAAIKRMLQDGLVTETSTPAREDSTDSRRRYYRITPPGRVVVREEARRIHRLERHLTHSGILSAALSSERGVQ